MSDINLTASMRTNLLSLQSTQSDMDTVSERLATGLKINSAIDNPSSYYTACALDSRVSDLSALMDAMGQSISTISAALEGIDSGTNFLEQASAVAVQASTNLNVVVKYDGSVFAEVATQTELEDAIASWQSGDGAIIITQDIVFEENTGLDLSNKDGIIIAGTNCVDGLGGTATLTFSFDETQAEAIGIEMSNNSMLSDLKIDYQSTCTTNDYAIMVDGKTNVEFNNLEIALTSSENGSSGIRNQNDGAIILSGMINIYAETGSASGVYGIHQASTTCTLLQNEDSTLNIKIKGTPSNCGTICSGTCSYYGEVNLYSSLGGNSHVNAGSVAYVYGELNILGGQYLYGTFYIYGEMNTAKTSSSFAISINYNVMSGGTLSTVSVGNSVNLNYEEGAVVAIQGTGVWLAESDGSIAKGTAFSTLDDNENFVYKREYLSTELSTIIAEGTQQLTDDRNLEHVVTYELESYSTQYNSILEQYDSLINDSSYNGLNLLAKDYLISYFNEDKTSFLEVDGVDASSSSIGLTEAKWDTLSDVLTSINELTDAINTLRSYSTDFGTQYSILINREDFTEALMNVLQTGSDKLTLADMNEESANMLALQTRQELATNSLGLSSQSAQQILSMFA